MSAESDNKVKEFMFMYNRHTRGGTGRLSDQNKRDYQRLTPAEKAAAVAMVGNPEHAAALQALPSLPVPQPVNPDGGRSRRRRRRGRTTAEKGGRSRRKTSKARRY
jgi:hypothetical protein